MRSSLLGAVAAAIVLVPATQLHSAGATAQTQTQVQPRQQRTPPRDATTPEERRGTATLRGRVVAGDTGRALRRARVTVSAPELGSTSRRTTSTGLDGRYEFTELPAARYRVSVTRGGYLPLDYGQRRPGEIGRPVQLVDGEVLEKIDFALPRMSVISGRVTDEAGDAIEGVSVYVLRSMFYEGRRKLVPVGGETTTDETGEYRVRRLAPGTYYVMASTKETWTVVDKGTETVFGYMPTYFPGVAKPPEGRRVTLGLGQEVGATDFSLVPGRAAKISGQALDSKGRPFSRVSLSEETRGVGFASFRAGPQVTVSPDGTFVAKNVPPGEYTLSASRFADSGEGDPEVAVVTVIVDGADIENIMLVGSSGGTVSGRVVVEAASAPKMSAITVSVVEALRNQPSPTVLGAFRRSGSANVKDDGTFSAAHVFGRARFQVSVPEGWMLKAVMHDGREITDAPVELGSGQELTDVQVIVTDRVTKIAGQLRDNKNQPLRDATVLVFPTDREKWFENSRMIRAARPDQQGAWEVTRLPAAEYLAVALDYVEDGAWHDPEFLESLRQYATTLQLAEGGSVNVALGLTVPK